MASTLGTYYVRLMNQSGVQVALFDDWVNLEYTNKVNDVGEYQFVINGDDARVPLFELDGQFEVWRSVPGMNVGWYLDYEGFHRKQERITTSDGKRMFVSRGVSYNDLLARTVIGYKEGTIRSEKNAPAETAMKEYVRENCTDLADDRTVVGRLNFDEHLGDPIYEPGPTGGFIGYTGEVVYTSALPGFTVEEDGFGGPNWQGERAYENLLSTLQDISGVSGVDFAVSGNGPAKFIFRTYLDGLGIDRRYSDLNPVTGLNGSGNIPVLFSVPFGTVREITYTNDRLKEANAVMVLGQGELSTKEVYTVADTDAIAASPWNRREVVRPGSNQDYDYQFRLIGKETLQENAANEGVDFTPLQTETNCLGLHYDIGDWVTARYDDIYMDKHITKVMIRISASEEGITIEFGDK